MRWTLLFLAVFLGPGCTHNVLKQNTLRSSTTLSCLQSQQVLDNLAMLGCDAAANPCHLNLTGGLVQVTDQGTATVLATVLSSGLASDNNFVPSLSAQRGLVEQWSVNPVADGEQLETLRVAYQKALHPEDTENDDAITDQIVGLCVRFSLLPKEKTIRRILKSKEPHREAKEICATLENEIEKLNARTSRMQPYVMQLKNDGNKTREALDLEMQILALEEKREDLENQGDLLRSLAGIPNPHVRAYRIRTLLTSGMGVLGLPTWHSFLAAWTLVPATQPSFSRKPSFSPRQAQRGITPAGSSNTAQLILTALQAKSPPGYLPPTDLLWETTRNPALVDQAEDQIARFEGLLFDDRFQAPWLYQGCKKDVPRCACYVGHFKACKHECYVWVMPDQYETLREFTQIILSLAAGNPEQDIPARSPAFSPSLR